ncbi:hypothetical protein GCM10009557_25840 [Virgisporangium ochraceum]|uniref:Uncharacterized protein n=1 Tax=Virgisporangium ochraceum TaxID=65505 RepID=A0A8J4A3X6_9ACTN|nr:hypothetical protein [Virgisporangium ochraceum]GIJ72905.1 hypothetical protein Voc01_078220 [Virgisporangium ochraceum]
MTFSEQLWLVLLQASSTAVFVTILGTVVVSSWTTRRERGRAAFETRTKILDEVARIGQGTYVFMQHTRRQIIRASDESDRAETLRALDQRFLDFSVEAARIQTVIRARFGVQRAAATPGAGAFLVEQEPADAHSGAGAGMPGREQPRAFAAHISV